MTIQLDHNTTICVKNPNRMCEITDIRQLQTVYLNWTYCVVRDCTQRGPDVRRNRGLSSVYLLIANS